MGFIGLFIALVPGYFYATTRHWLTNNLFGIVFSISGIESLSLPSFKIGYTMMWGLFFYDIFWVYGTDVMVTVAKSLDAPIKLMFPYDWEAVPPLFSMLGLGMIKSLTERRHCCARSLRGPQLEIRHRQNSRKEHWRHFHPLLQFLLRRLHFRHHHHLRRDGRLQPPSAGPSFLGAGLHFKHFNPSCF